MNHETNTSAGRPDLGLAVTLSADENGSTRLTINDIQKQRGVGELGWNSGSLFTQIDLTTEQLESLSLSRSQLAELGENILIRLLAINNRSARIKSDT